MITKDNSKPMVELLREVWGEGSCLVQQEIRLAKAEMAETFSCAGKDLTKLAVSGFLVASGALVLLAAISILASVGLIAAGLPREVALWLGPGLVGTVVTTIGVVMLLKAKKDLANRTLVPKKTIASLKEDKAWLHDRITQWSHSG